MNLWLLGTFLKDNPNLKFTMGNAFEELMAQAEQSVESKVVEHPVVDPEFQKATEEIAAEEGIEIVPSE